MKRLPLSLSLLFGLSSIIFCAYSWAADTAPVMTAKVASSTNAVPVNTLQIIVSLVLVVGVLIGLSVLFKKFGLNRMSTNMPVKIVSSFHIGNNQRIMVMEAGEEWVVLGVTPHHISTIATMPRQETQEIAAINNGNPTNAPEWLKNIVKKYQQKS